ncbi:MAG: tRNA (adenosine(37)-N6)-threonylcarbamoyltransferase complex transferase subunit TsaD [Chloroflexota bacterium]|nr:tRNA (adenosine(37)-N6)-threonylcarbamoyltransferase complex transferase subunit TsaD [Chloroflexota bacterium]
MSDSNSIAVLGIETSCDDTSIAIVRDRRCLALATQSSVDEHAAWGGIVPELAARQHILAIGPVLEQALADAGLELAEIDAIAATYGPGLAGSLLVGYNFGQGLAARLGIPLWPVNHLAAHAHACWLDLSPGDEPQFPAICLLVSGGHSELTVMHGPGDHRLLGRTRDDAVGEAFDKAARIMGLGFPGGPAIQAAAEQARATGLEPYRLPRPRLPDSLDFSLAGIKSAIGRARAGKLGPHERGQIFGASDPAEFERASPDSIGRMAAGLEDAIADMLIKNTLLAARRYSARSVLLCGGVAANLRLRSRLSADSPLKVHVPDFAYCVDNGAMVAISGDMSGWSAGAFPDIDPGLKLPGPNPAAR